MTIMKNNYLNLASASVLAFSAMMAPAANAAMVTGTATLTIDNAALKASNFYQMYLEKFWDASDNDLVINRATVGGTTFNDTDVASMVFDINTNTTTLYETVPSCSTSCTPPSFGRTLQATTMDAGDTSTGQIGLSGAMRMMLGMNMGYLMPYDLHVQKDAGVWNIYTYDSSFGYQDFLTMQNVSESLDSFGQLVLSGDIYWSGGWADRFAFNKTVDLGSFSVAPSAVAAVPVPAAFWMFGSALASLMGFGASRKKSVVSA